MDTSDALRQVKVAWDGRDAAAVVAHCREILEFDPDSEFALRFLARAAPLTEDWSILSDAGIALARRRPSEAFNAARHLSRAGYILQAAQIFSEIDIGPDWFNARAAEAAAKESLSLLKVGMSAAASGDERFARICWIAGARLNPTNRIFQERLLSLANAALQAARREDPARDPVAYIAAWREVLSLRTDDLDAAKRVARACDMSESPEECVRAWLHVLAIEPDDPAAKIKLRRLALQGQLDVVIQGLVELGRDELGDPLICELREAQREKANKLHERATKERLREAIGYARSLDREAAPRKYIEAWKDVLVADPKSLVAANKVISAARHLQDQGELASGLITVIDITGGDESLALRLAKAALRAGCEEQAVKTLARHGLMDPAVPHILSLRKRVLRTCRIALRSGDFATALTSFKALASADAFDTELLALQPTLLKKAAASARTAEKSGDLAAAVPLALEVLEIEPGQPLALGIAVRDLSRQRRYKDVVEYCGPRVGVGPDYSAVQRLLIRAQEMLTSTREHRVNGSDILPAAQRLQRANSAVDHSLTE
jgi:tetratricopeptide (TPR) repeat protein